MELSKRVLLYGVLYFFAIVISTKKTNKLHPKGYLKTNKLHPNGYLKTNKLHPNGHKTKLRAHLGGGN
jgi:hypothetical protein